MNNTIRVNTNKLYNYIKENNDMIEHLLYKLNKIKETIENNTYFDLETNKKYVDLEKLKEVI